MFFRIQPNERAIVSEPTPIDEGVIRDTVVVRSFSSSCGNCGGTVFPGTHAQCPSCGTVFRFSATNVSDRPLAEYASHYEKQWPGLEFVGVAILDGDPDSPYKYKLAEAYQR
jgi:hypothetical protein